ncbi:bifunctional DNA-formamidopyrimidine glycosylase/DNA-(apurinic or apyrimidinic site) lyase [Deinococcus yavapaiensis]|uniref:Formamidopyrimidine-DNA glycosylase n=1 Tax=Deinococcus yavapaiensis KR-236 TaxID=694435 RepID=A0A318SFI3_9DEIO|nr:bifunctional DNA-formamidopyrimidine glycosylase/DNA-(apurinic or apyrimidinic site) lyase [Deinococcus yavapaiensis]PYE56204.1 DNA-(apurinic or apyrimidinic site) lyase [Deinococcus yavapaiensis KR-236]
MPELPEVETTRRLLAPSFVGRTIVRVEHDAPHRYRDTHLAHGRTVEHLDRRGKYLIARLSGEPALELVVHLGMTGSFRPTHTPHTRVTFHFDDGTAAYFQDARRFGKVAVVPAGNYRSMPTLQKMGPEPLSDDFDADAFARAAAAAPAVKPWLLSQLPVAGVGNIYADEALWMAGVHPKQTRLEPDEARRLHAALRAVMTAAIESGGSTLRDYAQPSGEAGGFQFHHNAYGKDGQPCPRCGTSIEKSVVGQRGTHHCPTCQVLRQD